MKKVSLLAFVLSTTGTHWASAAATSFQPPMSFQGFHVGGNIGYGIGWAKQSATDIVPVIPPPEDPIRNNLGVRGVDGGIGTGYLQRFGHWGLGLAFDANWASVKGRAVESDTIAGVNSTLVSRARLENSLQLYGKLGYVMCGEQVMPFFGLGWDNSLWKQKITKTSSIAAPFTASKSKRFNAFLWKVGVDFLATRHVVVGLEYIGTIAGRKSFTKTSPTGEVITGSLKPQYNKFALTARVVY